MIIDDTFFDKPYDPTPADLEFRKEVLEHIGKGVENGIDLTFVMYFLDQFVSGMRCQIEADWDALMSRTLH